MAKFSVKAALLLLLSLYIGTLARTHLGELHCEEAEYRRMLEEITLVPQINSLCVESITGIIKYEPEEFMDNLNEILRYLCFLCDNTCLPYVADIVNYCLINLKPTLNLACASGGRFKCWAIPIFNNGSKIHEACYSAVEESTCSEDCRDKLIRIYSNHGCCVDNVFNTTLFGSELIRLGIASRDLWKKCNIQTMSPCPAPVILKARVDNEEFSRSNQLKTAFDIFVHVTCSTILSVMAI